MRDFELQFWLRLDQVIIIPPLHLLHSRDCLQLTHHELHPQCAHQSLPVLPQSSAHCLRVLSRQSELLQFSRQHIFAYSELDCCGEYEGESGLQTESFRFGESGVAGELGDTLSLSCQYIEGVA